MKAKERLGWEIRKYLFELNCLKLHRKVEWTLHIFKLTFSISRDQEP